MSKHTPDPHNEPLANANLIAAAPDLLAACIEALYWMDVTSRGEEACAKQLAAAIAKAESKP